MTHGGLTQAAHTPGQTPMSDTAALHTAPEYPHSQRPAHVQALVRPPAWCTATELAFLIFDKRDLERAQRFWTDFGLSTVTRSPEQLIMQIRSVIGNDFGIAIDSKSVTLHEVDPGKGYFYVAPEDLFTLIEAVRFINERKAA